LVSRSEANRLPDAFDFDLCFFCVEQRETERFCEAKSSEYTITQ